MKLKINILFLFYLINSNTFSQNILSKFQNDSVKVQVDYNFYNGYKNDSSFINLMRTHLYIGKSGTLTITETELLDNYINKLPISGTPGFQELIKEDLRSNDQVKKTLNVRILKTYNDPVFYKYGFLNGKEVVIEDTAVFNWELTPETKYIDTFFCQKAIIQYKDNVITAWFTEQIPLNAGPGFISGLPGLILEYTNVQKMVHYKVTKITTKSLGINKFRELSVVKIFSKKEYDKLLAMDQKKFENLIKMAESGKINSDLIQEKNQ